MPFTRIFERLLLIFLGGALSLQGFAQTVYTIKGAFFLNNQSYQELYESSIHFVNMQAHSAKRAGLSFSTKNGRNYTVRNDQICQYANRYFLDTSIAKCESFSKEDSNFEYNLTDSVITSCSSVGFDFDELYLNQLRGEDFYFGDCMTKTLSISDSNLEMVLLNDGSIQTLEFRRGKLPSISLGRTNVKKVCFLFCTLNFVSFGDRALPDTLCFNQIDFDDKESILDLTPYKRPLDKEIIITADASDFNKLKFNYVHYKLYFTPEEDSSIRNQDFETAVKQSTYPALIAMQKKYGYTDGEEKVIKEYKQFEYIKNGQVGGYFLNWLDKNWWDYGYRKSLIFRNTFYLLLFFYLINLFIYGKLVHKTYTIQEFESNYPIINKISFVSAIRYLFYCFFYTGFIFFGLKLDFADLKLKHLGLASYVIIQFVVGLICLAYLANYIITE